MTSGSNVDTSIPVELRALVPFSNGVGNFSTSLGGGNGRGGAPASEAYFAFDVPTGEPELTVNTAFKDGHFDNYSLYVVSPDGETLGHASNQLLTGGTVTDPQTTKTEPGAVSHVLSPVAGQWTLIVALTNPASGPLVSSPLTGSIDFDTVPVATNGLPQSTNTVIAVGQSQDSDHHHHQQLFGSPGVLPRRPAEPSRYRQTQVVDPVQEHSATAGCLRPDPAVDRSHRHHVGHRNRLGYRPGDI